MKQLVITLMIVFLTIGLSCQLNAQKDKKITIKIEKEIDGQKTMVDTTFTLKNDENLSEILEKYGVKADIHHKDDGKFDIEIEHCDSANKDAKHMVWISANDDGKAEKIKKKLKKVIIVDNDEDVEIIKLNGGKIIQIEDGSNDMVFEHSAGDSMIINRKIIISDDDEVEHKNHTKIYKIKYDSLENEDNTFFITDGENEEEKIVVKELKHGNDSIEVIIKKITRGNPKSGVYISNDEDFTWITGDTDTIMHKGKKLKKVMTKISDPNENDLKKLKLERNYERLEIDNFYIFLMEDKEKMSIKFTVPENNDLSVEIIDKNGKKVFSDSKKQFNGTYKNEIKALKGTFIIHINQSKKHFIKKMILEWHK